MGDRNDRKLINLSSTSYFLGVSFVVVFPKRYWSMGLLLEVNLRWDEFVFPIRIRW